LEVVLVASKGCCREPYSQLRALGRCSLPASFCLDGVEYRLVCEFKHDFFACSGLYAGGGRRVVLKMGRTADFLGLPLEWLGRWLVSREVRFYEQLQDVEGVPRLLGRVGPTAFVHEYVPGRPLRRCDRVNDSFFDRLEALVSAMHARGIAYVDLEKSENIIVGEDGSPYLIDFQISWQWPWRWGRNCWLARRLLRVFTSADRYHLAKHKRRCRPDLMDPSELAQSRRTGPLIKLHRLVFRPFTLLRRRILQHVERVRRSKQQRAA